MEEPAINWPDAAFDAQNQLFPSSVLTAESLDHMVSQANPTNLTYTTLESVKLVSVDETPLCTTITNAATARPHKQEMVEQPIDLTLGSQMNYADVGHYACRPQSTHEVVIPPPPPPQSCPPPTEQPNTMYEIVNNPPPHHPTPPHCIPAAPARAGYASRRSRRYGPTARENRQRNKLKSLVCEYIDYLVEENEHLTQISRAYTVPTPLDFENEHYFEEVRNTDHHFPTERFRAWLRMKEYRNIRCPDDYFQHANTHNILPVPQAAPPPAPPPPQTIIKTEKES